MYLIRCTVLKCVVVVKIGVLQICTEQNMPTQNAYLNGSGHFKHVP